MTLIDATIENPAVFRMFFQELIFLVEFPLIVFLFICSFAFSTSLEPLYPSLQASRLHSSGITANVRMFISVSKSNPARLRTHNSHN